MMPATVRRIKSVALLPLAAAILPYLATLGGGFVYDDHLLVEPRSGAEAGGAGVLAPWWGSVAAAGYWRPLATLSFALDRGLLGPGPAGHHAINLVLHALLALVAWDLARRLIGRAAPALAAACLFAAHPVHVEPVAWISARPDLLAGLLALAAWGVALRGFARPGAAGRALVLAAAALFALALLAKESAIALPLLIAAAGLFRPLGRHHVRTGTVLVLLVVTAWLLARSTVVTGWTGALPLNPLENPAVGLAAPDRLATVARAGAMAARLLVLPVPLRADYSVPVLQATPLASAAGTFSVALLAALAAGVAAMARRARRSLPAAIRENVPLSDGPLVALGMALSIAGWLPASSLLVPIGSLLAERYLLLASFGASLAAAGLLGLTADRVARLASPVARARAARAAFVALAGAAALGAAGLAARRAPLWTSDATLFAEEDRRATASFRIRYLRGLQLYAAGDDVGALDRLRAATSLAPGFAPAHEALGRTQLRLGRPADAAAAARAALEAAGPGGDPALLGRCHVLLGEALMAQGDLSAAAAEFGSAARVDPGGAAGPRLLGELLYGAQRIEEAIVAWTEAARRDPGDPVPHHNLAVAFLRLGRATAARNAIEQAMRLPDPPAGSAALRDRINAQLAAPPAPAPSRSPRDGAAPPPPP